MVPRLNHVSRHGYDPLVRTIEHLSTEKAVASIENVFDFIRGVEGAARNRAKYAEMIGSATARAKAMATYEAAEKARDGMRMDAVDWIKANLGDVEVDANGELTPVQRILAKKLSDPDVKQVVFTPNRRQQDAMTRPGFSDFSTTTVDEVSAKEWEPDPITKEDAVAQLEKLRDNLLALVDRPVTPADVEFQVDAEDNVLCFSVPRGRRVGIYFETQEAVDGFKRRLRATREIDVPMPLYVQPEPKSEIFVGDMPVYVADPTFWKAMCTRNPDVIDAWLNPPQEPRRFNNLTLGEPWRPEGDRS